ncbi:MAG TPA: arginine--tRNA ligase [Terriglobia bacterium]|nr:arginine--tRNA ligase [Terriglobia bacterium]
MYLEIQQNVRKKFVQAVEEVFRLKIAEPVLGFPPSVELGEISIASCFELAKRLRQAPPKIAEQLVPRLLPIPGVERVSIAGAGYLNFHLDRATVAAALFQVRARTAELGSPRPQVPHTQSKILVEHTSINPNKAAHIGHLRNAILGDTFARLLRFRGSPIEIQNYIDNTGVQVADVVVGFTHLDGKSVEDVRRLIEDPSVRFDYYCWDLYARVFQFYERDADRLTLRAEALKAIEEGHGELAAMADLIATEITRKHLSTMLRLNVRYDLLVQESEILRLDFWKYAFELLKQRHAIRYEEAGKNRGCWVMNLEGLESRDAEPEAATEAGETAPEDVKVIVRSNGTVTYVGKDIAYHLWKFGLLGMDFGYVPFSQYPDGHTVWRTAVTGVGVQGSGSEKEESGVRSQESGVGRESESKDGAPIPDSGVQSAIDNRQSAIPGFGGASAAYAVIDTRQSYLQDLIVVAFRALGFQQQAANLHHFDYALVRLSPRCAEELGVQLSESDGQRSPAKQPGALTPAVSGASDVAPQPRAYVEVSGRKGLGIKGDDLIDEVVKQALQEVRERQITHDAAEQAACARMIAVGALRYFLLKFSRRVIIVFDFKDALAFEGETGPYLQYGVVRARNIFRKYSDAQPEFDPRRLGKLVCTERLKTFFQGDSGREFWEMVLLAAQLEMVVEQAVASEEPAVLGKYAFRLAQGFSNFYQRHRILSEPDPERQLFLLYLVHVVSETLAQSLALLGIEVPERM